MSSKENKSDSIGVFDVKESADAPTMNDEKEALREFLANKPAPDDCTTQQPKDATETPSDVPGPTKNPSEVISTSVKELKQIDFNKAVIDESGFEKNDSGPNGAVSVFPVSAKAYKSETQDSVQVDNTEGKKGSPKSLSSTSGVFVKRADSKRDAGSSDLTENTSSDLGSSDEAASVGSKNVNNPRRHYPTRQFGEQVIEHLNSPELNSKLKQIEDLIQHVTDPTFSPSVEEELRKLKEAEESRESTSEDSSAWNLKESSNRKSKQREFEDTEEIEMQTKKPKILKIADRQFPETTNKQQENVREQFRLAYEESNQDLPSGKKDKVFSFNKLLPSKLDQAKEHFDEVADRILAAMSLSGQFLFRDLNAKDGGGENASGVEDSSGDGQPGLKSAGTQCNLSTASACSSPRLRASQSLNTNDAESSSAVRSVSLSSTAEAIRRRRGYDCVVIKRILTRMKNLLGYLWFSVFFLLAVFVARLFDVQDALEACCDYERTRALKKKENAKGDVQ